MKFSIIIPTRNRAEELKFALKTCLEQTFEDFEIIINDNCSTDHTKEMVESLHSDKIKYFREEETLAMTRNFQSALGKSTGDYVYVMGSDDGLCFDALEILDAIIKVTEFDIISWKCANFTWKDYFENCERIFEIPCETACGMLSGTEQVEKCSSGRMQYTNELPYLYNCAVVSRNLLKKLERESLKVFDSAIPDAYSGILLAMSAPYYFELGLSLSINAVSSTSNGTQQFFDDEENEEENLLMKDFTSLNQQVNQYSEFYAFMEAPVFCLDEAMETARHNLKGKMSGISRDVRVLIKNMLEYELGSITRQPKAYKKKYGQIVQQIKAFICSSNQYNYLLEWYEKDIETIYTEQLSRRLQNTTPSHRYGFHQNKYIVDSDACSIHTVYDAAQFMTKVQQKSKPVILEYAKKLGKCLQVLEQIEKRGVKRIGIYGAGIHGEILYKWIKGAGISKFNKTYEFNVCDSNAALVGKYLCNEIEITSLAEMIEHSPEVILIASNPFQEVIYNTITSKYDIKNLGISVIQLYASGDNNYFDIFM